MRARARFSRRTLLMFVAVVVLLILLVSAFVFREPKIPHVTAAFLSFPVSLRPRLAEFAITNHSRTVVHFLAYRFAIQSVSQTHQAETIPGGESAVVTLTVPEPIAAHTHLELIFRRKDTPMEEVREMLDSVLQSVGVKWPGLNPDSSANRFRITATIPAGGR